NARRSRAFVDGRGGANDDRLGRCRVDFDRCQHARRLVPHAEQAALALGQDDELDGVALKRGEAPLELMQRRPAGLADGLAGGLDLDSFVRGHRRFFGRFRRGAEPLLPEALGGLREVRGCLPIFAFSCFSTTGKWCPIVRFTRPFWQIVQMLVVIQYRPTPAGTRMMKPMKISDMLANR